jgi:hypothetical protein
LKKCMTSKMSPNIELNEYFGMNLLFSAKVNRYKKWAVDIFMVNVKTFWIISSARARAANYIII